ncbi:hypothetical protein HYPSUDRAFT_144382 [Hypholoma sublateritium FD-334 SS-4]|uniref:mitogen-activated protein kinase kinase n=1 Tax=Hypholoma sublateritium (strain FD-334 SS-4) TaxID=945553 RepID=A0A0D2NJ62_HYPSF|nr:hypothetical protein HYPSUDRAFT_144382 [Hypholoma sublateritium FD-334 SS-4]
MNPHQFSDAAFQDVALLGKSSTRVMYKVRHTLTGAVYACKTVTPREMQVNQLRQALRPLRALKHVNLVRCLGIYDGEYGEGDLKVVLEYHTGGNLGAIASRIKQAGGMIEEKVIGRITEGILQGLAHLHSLQILHRDIKPSNILLSSEGVVKLSEFVPAGESVNKVGDTFLSFVPYTAPERVQGVNYTDRADIWSMGITLLDCIHNRRPYPEHLEAVGLMLHIADVNAPCLDESAVWSDDMRNLFSQILVKDPKSRPSAWGLLRHPWITSVMQEDVRMDLWLRTARRVWNRPRPTSP